MTFYFSVFRITGAKCVQVALACSVDWIRIDVKFTSMTHFFLMIWIFHNPVFSLWLKHILYSMVTNVLQIKHVINGWMIDHRTWWKEIICEHRASNHIPYLMIYTHARTHTRNLEQTSHIHIVFSCQEGKEPSRIRLLPKFFFFAYTYERTSMRDTFKQDVTMNEKNVREKMWRLYALRRVFECLCAVK